MLLGSLNTELYWLVLALDDYPPEPTQRCSGGAANEIHICQTHRLGGHTRYIYNVPFSSKTLDLLWRPCNWCSGGAPTVPLTFGVCAMELKETHFGRHFSRDSAFSLNLKRSRIRRAKWDSIHPIYFPCVLKVAIHPGGSTSSCNLQDVGKLTQRSISLGPTQLWSDEVLTNLSNDSGSWYSLETWFRQCGLGFEGEAGVREQCQTQVSTGRKPWLQGLPKFQCSRLQLLSTQVKPRSDIFLIPYLSIHSFPTSWRASWWWQNGQVAYMFVLRVGRFETQSILSNGAATFRLLQLHLSCWIMSDGICIWPPWIISL